MFERQANKATIRQRDVTESGQPSGGEEKRQGRSTSAAGYI